MKHYRLIDHTADFGIEVDGKSLEDLFTNAAMALIDLITDPASLEAEESREIDIDGADVADLMVNWLREIHYLWAGEDRIAACVTVAPISDTRLSATIGLARFDPNRHEVLNEIKAVTYHQISVERTGDRWRARIILDV